MSDGVYSEKKSLIAVLLTLQKLEPEVYTDTMITAFCSVRDSFVRSIGNERLEQVARLVRIASSATRVRTRCPAYFRSKMSGNGETSR